MRAFKTDPIDQRNWEVSDHLEWKGTIGQGDSMMGLNVAHMMASLLKTTVKMDVHWYHSKDYLFHPEDPETIVQRFDYIKSMYYKNETVEINHIYNSTETDIKNIRFRGFIEDKKTRGSVINGLNSWIFRPDLFTPPERDKIVIWKPFNNATPAPSWKLSFGESDWSKIEKHYLKKKHRYNIVELSYRTPIREAFYHIRTCNYVVCYDGMWHYITRNFMKPSFVIGNQSVIKAHNPHAITMRKPDGYEKIFRNHDKMISHLETKCNTYRDKMFRYLNEN
jgi:hypothetical protein